MYNRLHFILLVRFAIFMIFEYLESQCGDSGDSYWCDLSGKGFESDIGYGYDFLEAFADYLNQIFEEEIKHEKLS